MEEVKDQDIKVLYKDKSKLEILADTITLGVKRKGGASEIAKQLECTPSAAAALIKNAKEGKTKFLTYLKLESVLGIELLEVQRCDYYSMPRYAKVSDL